MFVPLSELRATDPSASRESMSLNIGRVQRLKQLAKRSKWLVIAVTIVKDAQARRAARRGVPPSTSGATHETFSLEQSLAYIDSVFEDYVRYGQLEADLEGRRILELGPGDNYGVALRFLARGAERVVCVDRFASRRDDAQQSRIYEALHQRLGEADRRRLQTIEGVAVEEVGERLDPASFDVIVSRAVLEHLYDLDAAFAAMDRVLAPGGLMLHKVDFRDHGMFTDSGGHPLTFLTVSERLYRLMSRYSGRPNRRLIDWYRSKLAALGYESRILITRMVGREDELTPHVDGIVIDPSRDGRTLELLSSIRPRLQPRFQGLDDADLAVAGIFIVARKTR
jgi:SAM-dependent methyltransferase